MQHKERIKELRDRRRRAHAHRRRRSRARSRCRSPASATSRCVNTPPGRPPADPHLRRRVRRPRRRPRRSAASCCARARCSSCTTACRTSSASPSTCASSCPRRASPIAHGQMDEGTLEQVVLDFWERRVRRARVHDDRRERARHARRSTRSSSTAPTCSASRSSTSSAAGSVAAGSGPTPTCFIPPDRVLSEEAYERLKTIGEFTELGSGFKIAMRDLEIRGAGNLLGGEQSGHIAAVGFDLYCQMVTEAVGELKGEPVARAGRGHDRPARRRQPPARLRAQGRRADGGLPPARRGHRPTPTSTTSAPSGRTATGRSRPPAEALLDVARLRAEASRTGVREVTVVKPSGFGGAPSTARLSPLPLKASQQIRLKRLHPTAVYKEAEQLLVVKVPHKDHPADCPRGAAPRARPGRRARLNTQPSPRPRDPGCERWRFERPSHPGSRAPANRVRGRVTDVQLARRARAAASLRPSRTASST